MSKILIEEINRNRKVMGVQPLTESQEIDLILEDINKNNLLNEGWWETTKYALSKLGRYKADGKIFGKTQATAQAESKIRDLLMKKGNEIIQQLDKDIREIDPEFPNNKSRRSFLRCIILVSQTYDSIVASTKLSPTDPKFLPIDVANSLIKDLRTYVKKFLDTDLSAAFSVLENENNEGDLITEDELLDEAEPRSKRLSQAGKTGTFASTRMKTLKSNRLPLLLGGLGVSLGGLSWLMDSVWGQRLIEVPTEEEKIKYLKNTIGTIQPGQGLTQWLNMFEGAGLSPNSTPQQFLDAVTKVGNGDLDEGIKALTAEGGIFKDPNAARQVLEQIKNNPDGYKSLGEMFKGDWAGTGKSIGDTLVTIPGGSVVTTIAKKLTVPVLKKILVTTTAGSASPIVGAIGVGLIAAGAVVKGMRMKGLKSSRAKTLNDLYQSLVELEPTQENPSSGIIETGDEGVESNVNTGDTQTQKTNNDDNSAKTFGCVKNLIKATIQLNEMVNKGVVKIPTKPSQPTKQITSSIDKIVHNILREYIALNEAGATWNTANAAGVSQTNAPKGGALQVGETDAINSWNKVVKAFKQANVNAMIKPMELLINTSVSQGKDTLKAAQEDIISIGKLITQNRKTIGKVIPFEQLVKEAEDNSVTRRRNVEAIAKAISLVSRIIMAYKEDIGLTGSYGSAKAPMNLFIQAYDCVISGGVIKSVGNTTQTNNQSAKGQGNNQSTQGQETTQGNQNKETQTNQNIKGKEVTGDEGDGGMEDDSTSQEGSNEMNKGPKLLSLNQSMRPSFFGKGKK
jgi:hypothetical protein